MSFTILFGLMFLGSVFLLVILQIFKASTDRSNHLDKPKFHNGLFLLVRVIVAVMAVSFIFSVMIAGLHYRGKCPTSDIVVTNGNFDCPFWQFYTRMTLQRFFTGSRFYWP